jgi:conjugative transfer region protein TrbK
MRGQLFARRAVARAGGFALAAAALIAAALYMADGASPRLAHTSRPALSADAVAAELARCQALGDTAGNDTRCLGAWAENRRRFFTYLAEPGAPAATFKR